MAQVSLVRRLKWRRIVTYIIIVVLIILLATGVLSITGIWDTILLKPMLNLLILMSRYFLGSFGIAIIVLTIIIRLLVLPLNIRQLRSSRALRDMQPKIKELKETYANDRQKQGQEILKLYQEERVNPLGCIFVIIIQLPIWIALYQSVAQALAYTPENLVGLSRQLYSPSILQSTVPLNRYFLWLDLTRGDIFMAILTAVSIWVLQKISTIPDIGTQQQTTNRIMLWGLPLLFGFLAFTLPSGLSVFWVTSNIISIILQYRIAGWGSLRKPSLAFLRRGTPRPVHNPQAKKRGTTSVVKKTIKNATPGKGSAKTGSAGSEKNQAITSDIRPQGKNAGHVKPGDKRQG